jgi:hypothetical protein
MIGIFSSRAEAEDAVAELAKQNVPRAAIACLTDVDHERTSAMSAMGKFVGAFVGFGTGFSMGVVGSLLRAHNEVRQLLLSGFVIASLMALFSALLGARLCGAAVSFRPKLKSIGVDESNLDLKFVTTLLKQGSSLVIVNSDAVPSGPQVLVQPVSRHKSEAASSAA